MHLEKIALLARLAVLLTQKQGIAADVCSCNASITTECGTLGFLSDGHNASCNVTIYFMNNVLVPQTKDLIKSFSQWCIPKNKCNIPLKYSQNWVKFKIMSNKSFNVTFKDGNCHPLMMFYLKCLHTVDNSRKTTSVGWTASNNNTRLMTSPSTPLQQIYTTSVSEISVPQNAAVTYGLIGAAGALVFIGIVTVLILWQRRKRLNAAKVVMVANLQNTGVKASPLGVNDTTPIGNNRPGNVYEEYEQREMVDNELYQAHGGASERGDGSDYNAAYEMAGPNEKQVVENELYRM